MPDSETNESRDYLLGKLPEAAAESFEDRFFTSEDLLRGVEQEQHVLIQNYLAGALSAEEEAAFRARINRSTTLQNKVEVHRTLLRALERRANPTPEAPRRVNRSGIWFATACLAFAAALGTFLVHQRKPTQTQIAQTATPKPPHPLAAAPTAPDAVFFLSAAVTRGSDATPVLKIPSTANFIQLQIELPASAATAEHWKVLDLDGNLAANADASETQHTANDAYVPVRLPAEALKNGEHTIRLQRTAPVSLLVRRFSVRRIPNR